MRLLHLILPAALLTGAASAAAATAPSVLCETAITTAEYAGRLPPRMLGAIAQVESGRFDETVDAVRPWPWTINAEGEGHFYPTKQDAITAVRALQARGVRSIDVGCLQINLMFHPDAFASLDQAFDPRANALYAAHFLNQLHAQGDDWAHAIAAYHSDTPALGEPYRVMVMLRWQNPNPAYASARSLEYGAFLPTSAVYGAFAHPNQAYGAFASARR